MSERKVLTKYYPPDFDPRQIQRTKGNKGAKAKPQPVRIMAPFSMQCTSCGQYIYRGRKFNSRKTVPNEKYLGIQIYRFHIRCTQCSSEIIFRTDPQTSDYVCETGAKRNTEPWQTLDPKETLEERLDRMEQEEGEGGQNEETNAITELEQRTHDAEAQMAVGDALDTIRARNALRERHGRTGADPAAVSYEDDDEEARRKKEEEEDNDRARRAFAAASRGQDEETFGVGGDGDLPETVVPTSRGESIAPRPAKKPKKPLIAGLKKKTPSSGAKPSLLAGYDSDSS